MSIKSTASFLTSPVLYLLPLFFFVAYLLPLDATRLWQPDETRYAEISREMVETGDWIVPKLLGVRYFEKPVAGYWLNNIGQLLFGENNFGVRIASVFSTGVSALLVLWMGLRMWGRPFRDDSELGPVASQPGVNAARPALLATLMYLSLTLVYGIGTYSVLDPILTMWMTAAMASAYMALFAETRKGRMWAYALLGLACGMGMLTKGFLAFVLPVLGTVPAAVRAGRVKELFTIGFIAPLTALLVCLPWGIAVAIQEPDYWRYFFWEEHVHRFSAEKAQHAAPFWYYLPVLVVGVVPWLGFLPGALAHGWKERKACPSLFFLLCWLVLPFLFFSAARGKLLTYILPCMAPLALLLAHYTLHSMDKTTNSVWRNPFKINAGINLVLGGIGVLGLLIWALGLLPLHLFPNTGHGTALLMGTGILVCWIGTGLLGWRWPKQCWMLAAVTPLALISVYVVVMPETLLAQNKQPQTFIQANMDALKQARTVLADDPGVATGLAWELKRSHIMLYNRYGELDYGILRAPDPGKHSVSREDFPAWLEGARAEGNVALLLRTSKSDGELLQTLPKPDAITRTGKHVLFVYNQTLEHSHFEKALNQPSEQPLTHSQPAE